MWLESRYQKRFPRFFALLSDIKYLVEANSKIKKALLEYTGNNEESVNNSLALHSGSKPNIIPTIILPMDITFDVQEEHKLLASTPVVGQLDQNKLDNILVYESYIIRLEQGKTNGQIYGFAFFTVYNVLHELAHYLRYCNKISDFWKKEIYKKKEDQWTKNDYKLHDIDEQEVQEFTKKAFNFDEPIHSSAWYSKFSSYGIPYNVYYKTLQKKLEKEKQQKEEFNWQDFRSTYGPFGRFGNKDF